MALSGQGVVTGGMTSIATAMASWGLPGAPIGPKAGGGQGSGAGAEVSASRGGTYGGTGGGGPDGDFESQASDFKSAGKISLASWAVLLLIVVAAFKGSK